MANRACDGFGRNVATAANAASGRSMIWRAPGRDSLRRLLLSLAAEPAMAFRFVILTWTKVMVRASMVDAMVIRRSC